MKKEHKNMVEKCISIIGEEETIKIIQDVQKSYGKSNTLNSSVGQQKEIKTEENTSNKYWREMNYTNFTSTKWTKFVGKKKFIFIKNIVKDSSNPEVFLLSTTRKLGEPKYSFKSSTSDSRLYSSDFLTRTLRDAVIGEGTIFVFDTKSQMDDWIYSQSKDQKEVPKMGKVSDLEIEENRVGFYKSFDIPSISFDSPVVLDKDNILDYFVQGGNFFAIEVDSVKCTLEYKLSDKFLTGREYYFKPIQNYPPNLIGNQFISDSCYDSVYDAVNSGVPVYQFNTQSDLDNWINNSSNSQEELKEASGKSPIYAFSYASTILRLMHQDNQWAFINDKLSQSSPKLSLFSSDLKVDSVRLASISGIQVMRFEHYQDFKTWKERPREDIRLISESNYIDFKKSHTFDLSRNIYATTVYGVFTHRLSHETFDFIFSGDDCSTSTLFIGYHSIERAIEEAIKMRMQIYVFSNENDYAVWKAVNFENRIKVLEYSTSNRTMQNTIFSPVYSVPSVQGGEYYSVDELSNLTLKDLERCIVSESGVKYWEFFLRNGYYLCQCIFPAGNNAENIYNKTTDTVETILKRVFKWKYSLIVFDSVEEKEEFIQNLKHNKQNHLKAALKSEESKDVEYSPELIYAFFRNGEIFKLVTVSNSVVTYADFLSIKDRLEFKSFPHTTPEEAIMNAIDNEDQVLIFTSEDNFKLWAFQVLNLSLQEKIK